MATATQTGTPIAARVAELRELATADAPAAQKATWAWFKELGSRRDEEKLGELYALGQPPRELNGPTEGILVLPLIQGVFDRVASVVTKGWMPWLGKSFDAEAPRRSDPPSPRRP